MQGRMVEEKGKMLIFIIVTNNKYYLLHAKRPYSGRTDRKEDIKIHL